MLSHYDAVLWYQGDNRITQDREDVLTSTPFGQLPDLSVAEEQQHLTMAVRDYLNAGGKLVQAAETAQFEGFVGISDVVGGLYYGLDGAPEEECVIASVPGFFEDCLILADDFRQYWQGAYTRTSTGDAEGVQGVAEPIDGFSGTFGKPAADEDNPIDEAGVFVPTSDVLPPSEFPQFASQGVAEYVSASGVSPFAPVEGENYAGALHQDASYMRLSRTIDLTDATSAQLRFQLSHSVEAAYDHVIIEARTVGEDDWTTLPDVNGATTADAPAECTANGFLLNLHPFLRHYLGGPDCTDPGTTGTWNAFTGSSGGWQEVAVDLSDDAGSQVEVSISYVTDPAVGAVGAFVDDTRVVVDGEVVSADGFEGDTSEWTIGGPPAGSPPNQGNWEIGPQLLTLYAGTSTEDTVLLGFGLEQLSSDAERAALVLSALDGLLGQ